MTTACEVDNDKAFKSLGGDPTKQSREVLLILLKLYLKDNSWKYKELEGLGTELQVPAPSA